MSTVDSSGAGADSLVSLRARVVPDWQEWWLGADEGWWPFLVRLGDDLTEIAPGWSLRQAKEKFAELRFYANPGTDDVDVVRRFRARIAEAEVESRTTCERCGELGSVCRSTRGILKVLCGACIESIAHESGSRFLPLPAE